MPQPGFVFRKTALERLSTPERLDQLIQVTRPRSWIFLSALLGLLVAFVLWGLFGTLTMRIEGRGVLVESTDGALQAVIYIAAEARSRITPGMEVLIAPGTVRPEAYGYVRGEVVEVSARPATTAQMEALLQNDRLLDQMIGLGAPYEVRIDLMHDAVQPDTYVWTSAEGPATSLQAGTLCTAQITIARRSPFSLVVPGLDESLN